MGKALGESSRLCQLTARQNCPAPGPMPEGRAGLSRRQPDQHNSVGFALAAAQMCASGEFFHTRPVLELLGSAGRGEHVERLVRLRQRRGRE